MISAIEKEQVARLKGVVEWCVREAIVQNCQNLGKTLEHDKSASHRGARVTRAGGRRSILPQDCSTLESAQKPPSHVEGLQKPCQVFRFPDSQVFASIFFAFAFVNEILHASPRKNSTSKLSLCLKFGNLFPAVSSSTLLDPQQQDGCGESGKRGL